MQRQRVLLVKRSDLEQCVVVATRQPLLKIKFCGLLKILNGSLLISSVGAGKTPVVVG